MRLSPFSRVDLQARSKARYRFNISFFSASRSITSSFIYPLLSKKNYVIVTKTNKSRVILKYAKNCIIFVLSKIMKFIGFLLLCSCVLGNLNAQTTKPTPMKMGKNDTIKTYVTIVDGQPIPWIMYGEIKIVDTRIFKSQADRDAYNRLEYNVRRVWPYAQFAGQRYQQLQRDLALTADKHKQKELVSACNNQIKDLFKREVENLTISQ